MKEFVECSKLIIIINSLYMKKYIKQSPLILFLIYNWKIVVKLD